MICCGAEQELGWKVLEVMASHALRAVPHHSHNQHIVPWDFWCEECLFPVCVSAPVPKVWMEQEGSVGPRVL